MSRRTFTGKGLSRRALLRGLGGTAIALPFLDAMIGVGRRAYAQQQEQFPKRFVVWYTPNGTVPKNFWPTRNTEGSETDFTLSPILEPLADHKDDLLILEGLDLLAALDPDGHGDAHQSGTGTCLTGVPLLPGDFAGDGGESAGWAGALSIDQHIANTIGLETMFRSLEFGVLVQGSSVRSRISYRGPSQPLPPENSPYKMYQRLFGDPSVTPEELERQGARRQAVLDAVSGEYTRLRGRLGGDDRYKLENHLAAIQGIQDRLAKSRISFDGEICARYAQGDPLDVERVPNMPELARLQLDLMAMSFACDVTRVASVMWTQSTAGHVYGFINDDPAYEGLGSEIREGHHSLAHKSDTDLKKVEQNTAINNWHARQLAYFIQKLKDIPEGDGSVFDNTVILWTDEQARGNNHDRRNMPYVIAGSAGGHFSTGRYITQGSAIGHNRLLVSLMNSMGVEGNVFNTDKYGVDPISGLT
ncbi:DUF1552 domain-containing protein [Haliangium sp.]|uniref:DUF1552 domain-containing protein n=1 Tax=Haliangium sp. TaxID=2663208 RepID=UPI003D0E05F6